MSVYSLSSGDLVWSRLNATKKWWPAVILRQRGNKHGVRSRTTLLFWGGTHQYSWVTLKQVRCFEEPCINPSGLQRIIADEKDPHRLAALLEVASGRLKDAAAAAKKQHSQSSPDGDGDGNALPGNGPSSRQKRKRPPDKPERGPATPRERLVKAVLARRSRGAWMLHASGVAAAEATGVDGRHISDCCRGKRVRTTPYPP